MASASSIGHPPRGRMSARCGTWRRSQGRRDDHGDDAARRAAPSRPRRAAPALHPRRGPDRTRTASPFAICSRTPSGLPAFKAYDEITHDPDSLAKLMFSTPLDTLPGVRMVYSDIGAYMLGKLVERVTGQTLDAYVHDHVFVPLAMDETMYRPPASLLPRIAPTEVRSATRGTRARQGARRARRTISAASRRTPGSSAQATTSRVSRACT